MGFHPIDRDTYFLLPPAEHEWLSQEHSARQAKSIVEQHDLSAPGRGHAGKGRDACRSTPVLCLSIYGYATGAFASRKIKCSMYGSGRIRNIACKCHPDHDALAVD